MVHGRPKYSEPQRINADLVEELHQLSPLDPEHLPGEILFSPWYQARTSTAKKPTASSPVAALNTRSG